MSIRTVRKNSTVVKVAAAAARILLAGLLVHALIPASPAHADTTVCGQITEDTAWTPDGSNYIVTCDVTVVVGVTLTIEPEVVVRFDPATSLIVNGELIASAASFTSNSVTPAKGDWGQILFTATSQDALFDGGGHYVSGSIIQESLIEWGGSGEGVGGMVQATGASPFLDHNTVRNSSSRGIDAVGRSTSQRVRITRNTVSGNSSGVHVSAGELGSNTISNSGSSTWAGGIGKGVYATNSLITNNDVSDNVGGSGAGIYAEDSLLRGNTVTGNSTIPCVSGYGTPCNPYSIPPLYGGGVYSIGSDLVANTIAGNSIKNYYGEEAYGAGVYAVGGTLSENTVSGNVVAPDGLSTNCESKGGGIFSSLSTLADNVVEDNSVNGHNASGGGIYITGGTVTGNTLSGNTVTCTEDETSYGGGIYADGGVVMDNTLTNNTAAGGADSQGGGVYGDVNTISGNTLSGNSARRGAAIYSNKGTVSNNYITDNTASWSGAIYMFEGTALGNTLEGNSAVNGGGLVGTRAEFAGNIVQNNTANVGGGIAASECTVRGNIVTGNTAMSDGGGIYAEGGTVTGNTVTGNSVPSYGRGSGAYLLGAVDFTYNSIIENTASGGTAGGITIDGQPEVHFNNLYDNEPYDAEVVSADPVAATLNYWGESLCTEIAWQIYDGHDLPGLGELIYAPSLYSPVPLAQLDAPTDLVIAQGEDTVMLSWTPIDPIPYVGCQPDGYTGSGQGYSIYYSSDDPCGPFVELAYAGDVTSYELGGLCLKGTYYVVAAHDYLIRESAFTNVVACPVTGYLIYLPLVMRSA